MRKRYFFFLFIASLSVNYGSAKLKLSPVAVSNPQIIYGRASSNASIILLRTKHLPEGTYYNITCNLRAQSGSGGVIARYVRGDFGGYELLLFIPMCLRGGKQE